MTERQRLRFEVMTDTESLALFFHLLRIAAEAEGNRTRHKDSIFGLFFFIPPFSLDEDVWQARYSDGLQRIFHIPGLRTMSDLVFTRIISGS